MEYIKYFITHSLNMQQIEFDVNLKIVSAPIYQAYVYVYVYVYVDVCIYLYKLY